MSQISIRQLLRAIPALTLIALGLLLAGPNGPARAGPILDPLGDFLPTYTGAQDAGLDVLAHEVTLVGDRLNFFGRMAGPIAPTQAVGGLYLIGVDRGLGTSRFLNSPAAPPTIGPNVKWDAIVRILPNGTAFYLNSLLSVTTPLSGSDISIIGNEFNVSIPVSLMLPSGTKPPEEWTYNLWPRNGVGLNVQVSDLAPDDGNSPVHAVPEPALLTTCAIGAFGLLGCRWRRKRHTVRELVARRQIKQNPMTKHWTVLATASLATLLALFAPAPVARADIFKWKYINPANPALGKQQSTRLAPDGAGVNAVPGADLSNRNLTMAYLIGADLTGAYVAEANLTNADLSEANLTNAYFSFSAGNYPYYGYADLTGANFTNAQVRGAGFHRSNLSTAQLYSTASYQDHDLSGINLSGIDLTGWNFAGQILTNAGFSSWPHDPSWHTNLTNANLSGADVRGAQFYLTPLTGANFTGADVRGANFSSTGITATQLYSTASYQARDLTGIGLAGNDLTGANLADQNLMNAGFTGATLINANLSRANLTSAHANEANLTGANLSQANLTNANFAGYSYPEYDVDGNYLGEVIIPGANLSGANLNGADTRGANSYLATWAPASATNLIQSGGHIAGLDLTAGASLVVRDYDGNPAAHPPAGPLPIVVDQLLAMDAAGTLRLVFDADPWDSTISFAPGIPVARGGTLDLSFAPDVDVATQSGRTIDLFDWTGVNPTGAFTVSSPFAWDLTKLYTTGEVTLLPTADFDGDGAVNAADLTQWQGDVGLNGDSDSDNDGDSDGADFLAWQRQLGGPPIAAATEATPEPATLLLLISGMLAKLLPRRMAAPLTPKSKIPAGIRPIDA